jgi:hypothetical protein
MGTRYGVNRRKLISFIRFFVTVATIKHILYSNECIDSIEIRRVIFKHHEVVVEFVISNESIIFCIVGK